MLDFEKGQGLHSEIFWSQVKNAWPGTIVVNPKKIDFDKQTEVCIVLCPLYSPGKLEESNLVPYPASIDKSRVACKVRAYLDLLYAMNGYIFGLGGQIHLNAIFADKGVLFSGKPGSEGIKSLNHHKDVYTTAFYQFCRTHRISAHFSDYNDFGVQFPTFIDPKASLPPEAVSIPGGYRHLESRMIAQLNAYLKLPVAIEDSKKNRHVIERVLAMDNIGYYGVFWLIAGYLAFDYKISDIMGQSGIYIAAERFDPLFGIARLTKSLKEATRIQLKA